MNTALSTVARALRESHDDNSLTVPIPFQKPLDAEQVLMIDLITERYEGAGVAQFIKHETDDQVILIVPKAIRRKSYGEPIAKEASELLRIPENGGCSDVRC